MTLDLSHRLLGRGQQTQYRAAVRLRNDFEDRFHTLYILHIAYTCQGIFRQGCMAPVRLALLSVKITTARDRRCGRTYDVSRKSELTKRLVALSRRNRP